MITLADYMMGREALLPEDEAHKQRLLINAARTVQIANAILIACQLDRKVVSGYRPPEINAATKGAAPHSKHMSCLAVDLEDADCKLKQWCLANLDKLEAMGVWIENPSATPTWLHAQCVPPGSGNRVFIP